MEFVALPFWWSCCTTKATCFLRALIRRICERVDGCRSVLRSLRFLITGILLDTKDSENYFRNFYARRCLRIWPLYYSLIFLMFFIVPAIHKSSAQMSSNITSVTATASHLRSS